MRTIWEAILRDGHSSIISDSIYPGSGLCHPRVYGTFVRAIERYVRERGVLTLEEAVAKMTGLPAGRLGLRTKGKPIPGLDADILLFRPEALHERDSYADPVEFAEGIGDRSGRRRAGAGGRSHNRRKARGNTQAINKSQRFRQKTLRFFAI